MHSGKIRDLYADGPDLLLVASDKISVYDVVLSTPIPGKGKILTQLSLWWFDRLASIVPNHVISATDVPPQGAGKRSGAWSTPPCTDAPPNRSIPSTPAGVA